MTWDFAVAIGPAFFSFVLAYIAVNFKDNHAPLQIFFVSMSLIIAVADIFILANLAGLNVQPAIQAGLNSTYLIFILIFLFVTAYFIIKFFQDRFTKGPEEKI